jgi:hypothetical protein
MALLVKASLKLTLGMVLLQSQVGIKSLALQSKLTLAFTHDKIQQGSFRTSSTVGLSRKDPDTATATATSILNCDGMKIFQSCLMKFGLPDNVQLRLHQQFLTLGFTNTIELYSFALDFSSRPEVLSTILRQDFNFSVIDSHRARVALMELVRQYPQWENNYNKNHSKDKNSTPTEGEYLEAEPNDKVEITNTVDDDLVVTLPKLNVTTTKTFKTLHVNKNSAKRYEKSNENGNGHKYALSFTKDDSTAIYYRLQKELDQFLSYMTEPSAMYQQQEEPIRKATADVYIRHARLFLGWYVLNKVRLDDHKDANITSTVDDHSKTSELSLFTIIPDRESKSAQPIVDYIIWLRKHRNISDSYEANLLRGLTKLIKYRFASESKVDTSYGGKKFQDIPVVRELRRLHRDANKRQSISPRASNEVLKWISWEEYLSVVKALKNDLVEEIHLYERKTSSRYYPHENTSIKSNSTVTDTRMKRRIAIKFQNYLVLAFLSCIPDRQRTFRELELGRTFQREETRWIIKHGPKDYKTGGTYGDRPPLVLNPELTVHIDDFLERWRPCLQPTGPHVFVQPRTGKCFTQDSIYATVCRCCFRYTGKRTNPHLLRDMIVTHVRQSYASEKELEALALYMGHSITMQRNSYDRRTMQEKVAPAVVLLQTMNKRGEVS